MSTIEEIKAQHSVTATEPENVSEENILVDEISTVQATEAPATSQSKSPCDDPESPNRDLQ